MRINAIFPYAFFPDAGSNGVVSALHADLHEGEVEEKKGSLRYSYNSFAAPLVTFHREGIIVHQRIKRMLEGAVEFKKCELGRLIYYPVWKALDIEIDPVLGEKLETKRFFAIAPRAPKHLAERLSYYAVVSKTPQRTLKIDISFGRRCAVSSKKLVVPLKGELENFCYADGIIWVCSYSIYSRISPFVDWDFYGVTQVEYEG